MVGAWDADLLPEEEEQAAVASSAAKEGPCEAAGGRGRPVVARIVSRGKVRRLALAWVILLASPPPVVVVVVTSPVVPQVGQQASDFGCLEVVGGASIGHTDPYKVIEAVGARISEMRLIS